MKLIFLGTPVFAVPTLTGLARTSHTLMAVITQPDRPRGRGMKLASSPVKKAALELGLQVMQPDEAPSSSTLEELRKLGVEAAVVVAYGRILKRDFLDIPAFGCINLHPSLLPRYRGPTPIQSAILAGEQRTGATAMLLDEGTDTGDILLQREVEILPDDTAGILHDRLAEVGAELMIETLEAVENRRVVPRPQDESKATMTRKLEKKDSIIDWSRSPGEIYSLMRAMDPSPGCRTTLGGSSLKVWKIAPCEETAPEAPPGKVLKAAHGEFVVQAAGGAIRILELQRAGGRRMSAGEFMRGHPVAEGSMLGE
ncbi:MAG: methionyl-tRNA formyltransferase [Candidatus Abyssubacteria bacterium]|nr:methionyl-tRNA formyltransferase [Candidatus Abyssubacteria bacterium]